MYLKRANKPNLLVNFDGQTKTKEQLTTYLLQKPKTSLLPSKSSQTLSQLSDQQPHASNLYNGQKLLGAKKHSQVRLKQNGENQFIRSTTMKGSSFAVSKNKLQTEGDHFNKIRSPSSQSLYDHNAIKQQAQQKPSPQVSPVIRYKVPCSTETSEPLQDKLSIIYALVRRNKELRKQNIKKETLIQKLLVKLPDTSPKTNRQFQNEFLSQQFEIQSQLNFPKLKILQNQKSIPLLYPLEQMIFLNKSLHKSSQSEPVNIYEVEAITFRQSKIFTPQPQELSATQTYKDDLCFTFSEISKERVESELSSHPPSRKQPKSTAKSNFKNLPIEFQISPAQKKFFI